MFCFLPLFTLRNFINSRLKLRVYRKKKKFVFKKVYLKTIIPFVYIRRRKFPRKNRFPKTPTFLGIIKAKYRKKVKIKKKRKEQRKNNRQKKTGKKQRINKKPKRFKRFRKKYKPNVVKNNFFYMVS